MSNLLIVESPAKAKTIMKYLGGDFDVKASMGHLRDLPKKELGVDVDNNFECVYIPITGKDKVINELKAAAKKADMIYLATDPDREGEAISWHLQQLLELDEKKTCRVTFNEITKKAVTEAVQAPREIDMNLVDAQQARRILDRIVGYKLSPFLWRKVRTGLSAGRVQSVVTRLVVDREREIDAFIPEEYWSVTVEVSKNEQNFPAKFHTFDKDKVELKTEADAQKVLDMIAGGEYSVKTLKKSKRKRQPAPPFITSTLQQEAARKLGMTARRTMSLAQELYEGVEIPELGTTGLITYMRTDSLRVSDEAIAAARGFIQTTYGNDFLPDSPRAFKTKKSSQDAHEAVRPSNPEITPDSIKSSLTADQYRLYKLIWSRFLASQMTEAIFNTTSADIHCGGCIFRASGQTLVFPGFLTLYEESLDDNKDDDTATLPDLSEGDVLKHIKTEPKQHFTQPPPRYTEASLIKAMEEKGIGRPSTYSPTISVVLDRVYVIKDGKALKPTPLGEAVTDLIVDKFTDIVDTAFTADMEDKLDRVESGDVDYRKILDAFYTDFAAELEQAEKDMDKKRVKIRDEETDFVCDICGKKMVIKLGRFGRFMACSGYPECKNTKPISEDTGVPCPVCGAKLLKKKSKRGFSYFGCDKNPTCPFMTWDTPTKDHCPKCGGVIYRHSTKEEKKLLCHVPGCGYEQILSVKKPKEADAKEKKPAAKKTPAKKTTAKTPAKTPAKKTATKAAKGDSAEDEKPAAKKTAAKKPATKKPAAKSAAGTAKKTPAGKKAATETVADE